MYHITIISNYGVLPLNKEMKKQIYFRFQVKYTLDFKYVHVLNITIFCFKTLEVWTIFIVYEYKKQKFISLKFYFERTI